MDFENIDEFIETVEQPTVTDTLQKEYDKDLYKKWFRSKTRVGGTKEYDFEKIKALNPDLIIGNKEEIADI